MLHDRHYMRDPDFRDQKPAWSILIIINAVVFLSQILLPISAKNFFLDYLALSPKGISHGYIWQLLTFQFLHASFLHLLLNSLGIWMFGRVVEERLGRSSFLKLYLLAGVAGGLLQLLLGFLLPQHFGGATVGASAGTAGLFAAFCLMEPYAEIRVFLVFPVRAIHLLYAEITLAALFLLRSDGIAHGAHLGGILFAIAFMRLNIASRLPSFEMFRSFRRKPRRQYVTPAPAKSAAWKKPPATKVGELPSEEFISQEVDPILDKISAKGIHSLTDRERQILEAARKKMSKSKK